jgi:hypothetical protein
MNIQINAFQNEPLIFYESDNPFAVAEDFCAKHNLNKEAKQLIFFSLQEAEL